MRKIVLILCAMLVAGGLFAQGPPPGHEGGASASGHLYGKLVDSAGHGIGQASILLLKVYTDPASGKRKDQLLKGGATQNNGDFSLEDLPLNTLLKLTLSD